MSTVPAEPLIQLQGASRIFLADDVETHALAQVDLVITAGEYVTVAGPSGCGKSTLLSILGLLDTLTAGHYSLAGVAVDGLSLRERARLRNTAIGMVFQSFHLISEMTVLENVELPLTYRDLSSRQRREMAAAALERVGMSHRAKHFPAQLSGGQQQRVAVARAIVGSPSIMLADEPTGNLDSSNGTLVMDLLEDLNAAGTTLCLVTHDPRYAARSHRTVWMFDGRIQEGPPNQRPGL